MWSSLRNARLLLRASGVAAFLALATGAAAEGPAFTVIALPDTQFYTCPPGSGNCAGHLGIFAAQTAWIAAERDARNIAFVTHLGDCVQNGDVAAEWNLADQAYATIEAAIDAERPDGIPYGIAVGNHDQLPFGAPGSIPSVDAVLDPAQGTTTTGYNGTFGIERFCPSGSCRGYYGGHFGINNDNHYQLFSASGYDFVVLHLEYMQSDTALRQAVLAWADEVLAAFPGRRAIVTSHWVLYPGFDAPFSNQGQAIYQALKHHPGLFLILGGHFAGEGVRSDTFEGRTVHTLLADYQDRANGGNGWLRILEFRPASDTIAVRTYSPFLDAYETDADSEFTLAYAMDPACADGLDNDGDGLVDFPADPGCFDAASTREDPECQDGIDNDGQAGIDFDGGASLDLDGDGSIDAAFNPDTPAVGAADPQCVGKPARNREAASCGLGAELALLLAAPWALRRRRQG